ncbi:MAG TPA: sugar ABC transporter substrate-binding protein [Actinomycetes bacterium]|jgi:simple sugar transport system substrate-binding protein|nr:sugar ABC transporter substrate-binding protein [Actinomycetes bacterium]
MTRLRHHPLLAALAVTMLLAAAACSSSGGKKAEESSAANVGAGKANTPKITIAMVTHGAPSDTFWDIIRKGAQAAAAKDNVTLKYSSDPDSGKQATLIQSAIDSKVDGIAVTLPDPPAIAPTVKKAIAAGIPVVAFNAGIGQYQQSGAMSYFGSDESLAGQTAGKRASADGYKNLLCVIQFQGQVQLEARCDGVKSTFSGKWSKIYVNGNDRPAEQSTIAAKLKQDPSIDFVVTLGAPDALAAMNAVKESGSKAKVGTFDFNPQIPPKIQSGELQWAIDQQPFLQGYESIDSLWLYKTNGNILGGGKPTLTGPFVVDKSNIDVVGKFAEAGTR